MTSSLKLSCLGGIEFSNPFMNAAGVKCSNQEELDEMRLSVAGSQITKSCTAEFRQGNPEPRYSPAPLGSINSMGLPNQGFAFYRDYALSSLRHNLDDDDNNNNKKKKKPIFFSIAGLTLEEVVRMCAELSPASEGFEKTGGPILELNLSCPNVPGKPQVGYDFAAMEKYLTEVCKVFKPDFGVKLPPYFDMIHFDTAAEILNRFPQVKFLSCINSVGNTLIIDTEKESVVIKPKDGFGGLGGKYVLPIALANVNAFFRRCPEKIIFGCGGVTNGDEAFQHILAGATLVQIGTQLYEEGIEVFKRLNDELLKIMEKKGYKTLDEFRGKLKTIQ